MIGKLILLVATALLVVGISLSVVAVVNQFKENSISPQQKTARALCDNAHEKAPCIKTLEAANSDDPIFLVNALIVGTKDAIKRARQFTRTLEMGDEGGEHDGKQKVALDYCNKVFNYAAQDLESFLVAFSKNVTTLSERFLDFKRWLVSVYVYQNDCLNDISHYDYLQNMIKEGASDAKALTSDAIDILDTFFQYLERTGLATTIPLSQPPTPTRRLLSETHGERLRSGGLSSDAEGIHPESRELLASYGINKRRNRLENGRPNLVVAQDGSGNFTTVSAAIEAYNPEENKGSSFRIYVKSGIYREQVIIPKDKPNVYIYGDGASKTIITNNRSCALTPGTTTSTSATFQVESEGFAAKRLTFKNTAGPRGNQAVALRINGDRAILQHCRIDGYQNSLYADSGRQFYRNCIIRGTVDIIFGTSATVIQNSNIVVKNGFTGQINTVIAEGNDNGPGLQTGIVLHKCRILPDKKLAAVKSKVKSYLGRSSKPYSTAVVMESLIEDFIRPEGWLKKKGTNYHDTCIIREYKNKGAGAKIHKRVHWKGFKIVDEPSEMQPFMVENFLKPLAWVEDSGVPVQHGADQN